MERDNQGRQVEGKPIVKWERAVSEQTRATEVARKSSDI